MVNNFFSWNCIFCSLKVFPSSKIDFWAFLKLQKMEFGGNIFFVKLIYLISRVFLAWTFFNFLAYCENCSWFFVKENSIFRIRSSPTHCFFNQKSTFWNQENRFLKSKINSWKREREKKINFWIDFINLYIVCTTTIISITILTWTILVCHESL